MHRYVHAVKAKEYEAGDEDGFVTRYTDNVVREDGAVCTWGWPSGDEGEVAIQVPFIDVDGRKILVGEGWTIGVEEYRDKRFAMPTHEFKKKYTLPVRKPVKVFIHHQKDSPQMRVLAEDGREVFNGHENDFLTSPESLAYFLRQVNVYAIVKDDLKDEDLSDLVKQGRKG